MPSGGLSCSRTLMKLPECSGMPYEGLCSGAQSCIGLVVPWALTGSPSGAQHLTHITSASAHIYTYIHVHTDTHIHIQMHHTSISLPYTCTHGCTYTHILTCVHTPNQHLTLIIHTYIHIHVCTHIYTYICTHTHRTLASLSCMHIQLHRKLSPGHGEGLGPDPSLGSHLQT